MYFLINIFFHHIVRLLRKLAHLMQNLILSILIPKSRKYHNSSYGNLGSGPYSIDYILSIIRFMVIVISMSNDSPTGIKMIHLL